VLSAGEGRRLSVRVPAGVELDKPNPAFTGPF
jgi:hypothetical protein